MIDTDLPEMNRETAWRLFIAGFTGTAYARRTMTRIQAGPLEGVYFTGDEQQENTPFHEFFVRNCDSSEALAAVAAARPLAEHYITVLEEQPSTILDYTRTGRYILIHSETLMACDLRDVHLPDPLPAVMVAQTAAEAEWLNTHDPQGIRWIPPDNLADPLVRHYAIIADNLPVVRGRNLWLDSAHSYVSRIYTAGAYRRRGLARILMQRLLADDRARGAHWSILTASTMGSRLYEDLGYRSLGSIHVFHPATHV